MKSSENIINKKNGKKTSSFKTYNSFHSYNKMYFMKQLRNRASTSSLNKFKMLKYSKFRKINDNYNKALHEAIEGDTSLESIYRIIIRAPESVGYKDANGRYPIHIAASKSNVNLSPQDYEDLVLLLVEAFPEALTEFDDSFNLPFHHACRSGNISMALIEAYAVSAPSTLSVENGSCETPIEVAITSDNCYDKKMIKAFSAFTGEYERWRRHSCGELYRQATRLFPCERSLECQ